MDKPKDFGLDLFILMASRRGRDSRTSAGECQESTSSGKRVDPVSDFIGRVQDVQRPGIIARWSTDEDMIPVGFKIDMEEREMHI